MPVQMISRNNAAALIEPEVANQIMSGVRSASVALRRLKRLPNMSTSVRSMPVLSMLPSADFVNGDAGMKVTTNAAWDKKMMTVGEVAAVVPIPQAVLDDADYNIWGEVRPLLVESLARVIDRQIFSERNPKAPTDWPTPIIPGAVAAGKVITYGTGSDVFEDLSALFSLLEAQQFDVTGLLAQRQLKSTLRDTRTPDGVPLYQPLTGTQPSTIYGVSSEFVKPGTWDITKALLLAGEWEYAAYAIRQDITYQIFDTGVISDDDGTIVYNLLQQDMVAMRVVMRLGWQMAWPIDIDRPYGEGYPFAALLPA